MRVMSDIESIALVMLDMSSGLVGSGSTVSPFEYLNSHVLGM